jgi:hypothetical protein
MDERTTEFVMTKPKPSALVIPRLYCPEPVRIDDALGDLLDDMLLPWIEQAGIYAGQSETFRAGHYGRFAMLCHADTDDPARLFLSAQCMAALFAVDDYYCDDASNGSIPSLVRPRLSLALAAVEPAHLPGGYAVELAQALQREPVLRALGMYMASVVKASTASQAARVRHEIVAMFVTMTAEAAWRINGTTPDVWEYLAHRQVNSFLPCMSLIDIVGGYELPANIYSAPAVRRVTTLAASATTIANDIYSAAKEELSEVGDFKLAQLLVARHDCTLQEGVNRAAGIHDDIVHSYEAAEHELLREAAPVLKRYLSGIKAWLGGNRQWHQDSGRYRV